MHTTLLSCLFLAFFTVVASCPNLSTKSFRVQNYDFSTEIQREWGEIRCLVFLANSFIVTCQAAHLYNIFHPSCKDLRNSMQAHHSLLSPLLGPFYTTDRAITLAFSALQISSYFHPNLFSDS